MKILDNTDQEFCKCFGPEYKLDSSWGMHYCIINIRGECCAEAEVEGKVCHSKEALFESYERCPKCQGFIYIVAKHP